METQTETTAYANGTRTEETSLARLSPRAILSAEALKFEAEQRELLKQFIARMMVEGVDYGKIPGTDKPTLLKPGAEKLTDLFRCTPKFTLLSKEEDFDRGFCNYMFRVRLYQRDSEAVVAEGYGSANSREGRYRWRNGERKCPSCGKATIIKGKAEYGGGWLCFAKKGGCGAKWQTGAPEIESQEVGRVENDDVATLFNTILKMAKKRALVDGAIALARCSDLFTQDVEDFAHHNEEPVSQQPAEKPQAKAAEPARASKPAANPERAAIEKRARAIWDEARKAGRTDAQIAEFVEMVLGRKVKWDRLTLIEIEQLEKALPDFIRPAEQDDIPF